MDLNRQEFKLDFHGRPLVLEVSRLAEQATASVLGRYGETAVLVTATIAKKDREVNYFPLIVDYEERFYAAGKILGSRYVRREGKASEEAVLSGRIIDRTIRPLFDHRLRRDVQIIVTILALDDEDDPDFITLLTTSATLLISEIPWDGPVAAVKILKSHDKDEYIVNPTATQIKAGFELVTLVAGTETQINMVEMEGREAKEVNAVRAFEIAQKEITLLNQFQEKMRKVVGAVKIPLEIKEHPKLATTIKKFLATRLEAALYELDKTLRNQKLETLEKELTAHLEEEGILEGERKLTTYYFEEALDELTHRKILGEDKRPDGRKLDEVRELHAEVGLFKRNHGSAVFIRGNTQSLAVTTLGPPNAEQFIETIEFSGKRRFLLHYNFPPYSVGEVGPMRGPGRREIGHGALAEKALRNIIPDKEIFPYTIRVVSEILSSNGSSSMATVSAACLSLMDAGVPIKKAVAGIAMGLMSDEKGNYKILTDIQGPEDHYGDMDFKAAGTIDGLTAIQMDVKIRGVLPTVLGEILDHAKKARLHILEVMKKTLAAPRPELSPYAPILLTIRINPERIGEIIGPGGKVINGIISRTGVLSIDIEEDGEVVIAADNKEKAEMALAEVKSIVKEFTIGEIVEGKIVKILEFGAILQIDQTHDGMIHVSELKEGYVKRVEDVLKVGDFVRAKIIKVEPGGRIGLSLKNLSS